MADFDSDVVAVVDPGVANSLVVGDCAELELWLERWKYLEVESWLFPRLYQSKNESE